jgi:hypothetical protein
VRLISISCTLVCSFRTSPRPRLHCVITKVAAMSAYKMLYFSVLTIILCCCFIFVHHALLNQAYELRCEGPECALPAVTFLDTSTRLRRLSAQPTNLINEDLLPRHVAGGQLQVAAAEKSPATAGPKKRIILSVATGHSGTLWLSSVLKCTMQRMRSKHEAEPSMVFFNRVLAEGLSATYDLRQRAKVPPMVKAFNDLRQGETYADIDHMFVKSWGDVMSDWFLDNDPDGTKYQVDVIVLRRHIPALLNSLMTLSLPWDLTQDPAGYIGGIYTLHNPQFTLLKPIGALGSEDAVDMAMGYIVDIEMQYLALRKKYTFLRFHEVRAEQLFTIPGARAVLEDLDLAPIDGNCLAQTFADNNRNSHSGTRPNILPLTLEEYEQRALQFIKKYEASGQTLPPLPHMQGGKPCDANPRKWCPG